LHKQSNSEKEKTTCKTLDIVFAHTIIYIKTVMVKCINAAVTDITMLASRRYFDLMT